jgi:hypothetical protein
VAPQRRRFGGAITPTITWLLYADDLVAPLRRRSAGSITPTTEWLLYADDSHQDPHVVKVNNREYVRDNPDRSKEDNVNRRK